MACHRILPGRGCAALGNSEARGSYDRPSQAMCRGRRFHHGKPRAGVPLEADSVGVWHANGDHQKRFLQSEGSRARWLSSARQAPTPGKKIPAERVTLRGDGRELHQPARERAELTIAKSVRLSQHRCEILTSRVTSCRGSIRVGHSGDEAAFPGAGPPHLSSAEQ